MKVKERKEIQKVFQDMIEYLDKNISHSHIYLCNMLSFVGKKYASGRFKDCGYNDRMVVNAIKYLKSEMPTKQLNKKIYNAPLFTKDALLDNTWWDYSCISSPVNTAINQEKKDFLYHLIKKLK